MAKVSTIDIYIRMNEDPEQDYCFNVPANEPISWLHDIFKTLPMVLSPSYFYNAAPVAFAVSKHPGFLTSEGALLFERVAHMPQHRKKVDQSSKISDVLVEGQLVVPIWEYNYSRLIKVVSLLILWLYLDFPVYLNPTPGYAPTTLIMHAAEKLIPQLKDDSPSGFNSPAWQWGFFAMHVFKCAFIYMILWVGGINPASFNPMTNRKVVRKEITRQKLLDIGWTSTRRATPSEWRDENRKNKIEQQGGLIPAYHAGVLEGIGSAGVPLNAGEGFDTNPDEIDRDDGKFRIDKKYFALLYREMAKQLKDQEDVEVKNLIIKQFRRIGPEIGCKELKERYEERKKVETEEENSKKKK